MNTSTSRCLASDELFVLDGQMPATAINSLAEGDAAIVNASVTSLRNGTASSVFDENGFAPGIVN